jgi:hypothetical protein
MSAAFEKTLADLGTQDRQSEAAGRIALRNASQTKLYESAVQWYRRETVPA